LSPLAVLGSALLLLENSGIVLPLVRPFEIPGGDFGEHGVVRSHEALNESLLFWRARWHPALYRSCKVFGLIRNWFRLIRDLEDTCEHRP